MTMTSQAETAQRPERAAPAQEPQQYRCPTCGQLFSTQGDLRGHEKVCRTYPETD